MYNISELVARVNARYGWTSQLKPLQSEVLNDLLVGRNVVGILPTGYGKSLIYTMLPLMLDEVNLRYIFKDYMLLQPLPIVIVPNFIDI